MGLEELTFAVEGVLVMIKPELQMYHQSAEHDPAIGKVPVIVHYNVSVRDGNSGNMESETVVKSGHLQYDTGKKNFISSLTDFVPTEDRELMKKYAQGMSEVADIYSTMLNTRNPATTQRLIRERHFFRNSKGEWKDIGEHWYEVLSNAEIREIADSIG